MGFRRRHPGFRKGIWSEFWNSPSWEPKLGCLTSQICFFFLLSREYSFSLQGKNWTFNKVKSFTSVFQKMISYPSSAFKYYISIISPLWFSGIMSINLGIPNHLICLLKNLYAGQEATVRTGHETTDWLQIGKGVHQGYILSHCLLSLYAEYIMRNAGLDEAQAGIKIAWRNINTLRYADDTTLMAESEDELKSLLIKVKEESEKVGLKLNTQKTKLMASGPITSWKIDCKMVETMSDFIFWGSKITADGDCSHEIKRRLLLGRKVMTNLVYWKAETLLCQQRSV